MKIDNHRALEVGHLNESLGNFKVRKPEGSEVYLEVTVRESPDELTLWAEEVGTWKSIHQCRPHRKGEVDSFLGWLRLVRLLSGVVQRHRRRRLGRGCTMLTKRWAGRWEWRSHRRPKSCSQIHLTRHFSPAQCTCLMMYNHTTWLKTSHTMCPCSAHSYHLHAIHDERLIVSRCFSVPRFVPFRVSLLHLALLFPLLLVLWREPLLPRGQRQGKHTLRLRQMRSPAPWPNSLLSQVMSPSSLTTSTTRRLLKSPSGTNSATKTRCSDTCVTRNSTMRPSESAIFTTVRSGARRISGPKTSLSLFEESLLPSQSFFAHSRTGETRTNFVRQVRAAKKNQVAKRKTKQSEFSLKDKKKQFSLILEQIFRSTNLKPILVGEVFRNWMELSNLSEEKLIDNALAGDEQLRRDQELLHEQLSEQNRDLREAHMKSLNEMEELKRFQGSRFDEFSEKKIDRKSRHNQSTHGQNSGNKEWS